MVYHILNGDSLAGTFPSANIPGEIVVMRECLIEGDVRASTLDDFIRIRAQFIAGSYQEEESGYYNNVGSEFKKVAGAPGHSEFNLWFEYDLFCQVNMWFIISLIADLTVPKSVYIVYPTYLNKGDRNFWGGFGPANADDLRVSFSGRVSLNETDLQFGKSLWQAYQRQDLEQLQLLSGNQSAAFPYIREVIEAHVDRFPRGYSKGRPERVLEEIIAEGDTDFHHVLEKFWKRESIYGFGDAQVKRIYDTIIGNH